MEQKKVTPGVVTVAEDEDQNENGIEWDDVTTDEEIDPMKSRLNKSVQSDGPMDFSSFGKTNEEFASWYLKLFGYLPEFVSNTWRRKVIYKQ